MQNDVPHFDEEVNDLIEDEPEDGAEAASREHKDRGKWLSNMKAENQSLDVGAKVFSEPMVKYISWAKLVAFTISE